MAAAPAAAAPAAAAAVEEPVVAAAAKTHFTVKLDSFNAADKVKVIKEVRTLTGKGLKEAKELVESCPQILKKDCAKEESEKLVALFKDIGAVVVME
jgi:large subunit ribosomal protein L7/L12